MYRRTVEVSLEHPQLRVEPTAVRRLIHCLDAYHRYQVPRGTLSIAFLTNAVIGSIHADFMNDPSPTDVITFPGTPPEDAGEICVSVDYAIRAARRFHSTPTYELQLYLVHGWLHLAGFDDRTQRQKRRMRMAEREMMSLLARSAKDIPFFFRGMASSHFSSVDQLQKQP